jgi:hypothetical protein
VLKSKFTETLRRLLPHQNFRITELADIRITSSLKGDGTDVAFNAGAAAGMTLMSASSFVGAPSLPAPPRNQASLC